MASSISTRKGAHARFPSRRPRNGNRSSTNCTRRSVLTLPSRAQDLLTLSVVTPRSRKRLYAAPPCLHLGQSDEHDVWPDQAELLRSVRSSRRSSSFGIPPCATCPELDNQKRPNARHAQ